MQANGHAGWHCWVWRHCPGISMGSTFKFSCDPWGSSPVHHTYLWGLIVSQDPRASKLLCLRQAPVCLQSLSCPFSAVPISLSGISSDLLSFLPKSHGILDRLQSSLYLKSLLSQRMKATSTLWHCYIKLEDTWTLPDIKKERKKHHHGSLLCYFLPRQTSQKWRLRTKGDVNCVTLRAIQP